MKLLLLHFSTLHHFVIIEKTCRRGAFITKSLHIEQDNLDKSRGRNERSGMFLGPVKALKR
jgi:hypothetical protein